MENGIEYQFQTHRNRALHGLQRSPAPSPLWYAAMAAGCGPGVGAGGGRGRHEEMQYLDAIR